MQYSDGDALDGKKKETNLRRADLIDKVAAVLEIPDNEATPGREGADPRLREFPHARTTKPHRTQFENRSTSRSSSKEDSLLQAEQGTSGACSENGVGRYLNCTLRFRS
jgi:hypothetical protein